MGNSPLPQEHRVHQHRVYLGLGANLGDPPRHLRDCLRALTTEVDHLEISPLYRTQPVSEIPQPWYLNLVATGVTRLAPYDLLGFLQSLERAAGRDRRQPDAPRTLDVDLLLYGRLESEDSSLTLPHPRMRHRRFVLAPLADLAPDLKIPPDNKTVDQLLTDLPRGEQVQLVPWPIAERP
ncbi:MAG: 2-amino-4-hydroxy-6-hydroxymethyldihydropteridine diphosphokinase [Deltaproteobacteria bacterium]|nr:2-amino-4-hydroxy-6-hydroxymethyldihydropteridine diphosphokinase [Deltaproteobacteria bacterium]